MTPNPKARILAEALPYIRAYHGKTLVIRFGGHAMADEVLKAGFARDVALLRLVGMKPIVVHGGGWRIDELLKRTGKQSHRHRGVRITDESTLTVVEMALGELNQELVGLINRHGGRAVGLNGQDGRFIHARRMTLPPGQDDGIDLGFVGDIESIDLGLVELLLSRNFIPVIMPIGVGGDGTAYHINSDLLASRLARTLAAEKLILMTNVPGVHDRSGKLVYVLGAQEAEALLRDGIVDGGMRPRVTAALQAVREGVRSVHIIDGGVPSALLLEILTAEGVGTALRSDAAPPFLEASRDYLLAQ
ncbi:MAG TPA: acetylglutamate kinase [Casimicrobiaceae bacterium]|nr:acetylglutamate kinase [Casimicrobiaceae bacterium]